MICMWLYLLHIFLLSLLFISFYPLELNTVKWWNSDEDNSAEVWYPLPGCVHNRKIGSGAGCEARRWKFMNNEGGLSLPQVPNLTFPWFGSGETEVEWRCFYKVRCGLYTLLLKFLLTRRMFFIELFNLNLTSYYHFDDPL